MVPQGPVRVGECGWEPVWRALVAVDGFNLLPSSCFRRTQALVGSAREPPECDSLGANWRLLLADKRDHLCFYPLAAALALIAEDRVSKPGDFLLNGFSQGLVGPGKAILDSAARSACPGDPEGFEGGSAGRCPIRWWP